MDRYNPKTYNRQPGPFTNVGSDGYFRITPQITSMQKARLIYMAGVTGMSASEIVRQALDSYLIQIDDEKLASQIEIREAGTSKSPLDMQYWPCPKCHLPVVETSEFCHHNGCGEPRPSDASFSSIEELATIIVKQKEALPKPQRITNPYVEAFEKQEKLKGEKDK
jgi:hypothetical protein